MADYIMAQANSRHITGVDKIFAASSAAKEAIARVGREKVANSTIGALLGDRGELMVLSSVAEVLKDLSPVQFAEYAPIAGIPGFDEAVKSVVFGDYTPLSFVEAVASPGGTGAIRNSIQNYTCRGDAVLTSDWFWAPYRTIAEDIERRLETYPLFTEDFRFNINGFRKKAEEIIAGQDRFLVIINTPAHNPTGYTLTDEDWAQVLSFLSEKAEAFPEKRFTVLADIAYMDFAGEAAKFRSFFSLLDGPLPKNLLPLIAFSMSKSFTLYGMRCGALVCMSRHKEVAAEFKQVCAFSSRASWSNCSRAPMEVLKRFATDPALKSRLEEERTGFMELLHRRGAAFVAAAEAAGLSIAPYQAGFFISIPCKDPDGAAALLQKDNIFLVPLAKGLRVSVASLSEEWCTMLPAKIRKAIDATS